MHVERTEVLVIGAGGAGLRAAIELHDHKVDVLVVGKCKKRDAHTKMATGGINAALGTLDPKDNWQLHAADTIKDGGELNDPAAVEVMCKNAPYAIKELLKWGAKFAKDKKSGKVLQRFFGAATYRRAVFASDHTGQEILYTLVRQAEKRNIRFKTEVYIFSLLQDRRKRVNGALGVEMNTGKIIAFQANAVILATGGFSRIYARSSSRFWENNADGIALAREAGCRFMDMELFQFHPTGMVWPKEQAGTLVTEAVRGEGGRLFNAKGQRFMKKYAPKRMELSPRDVVARAIYMEIAAGRGTKQGGVNLCITDKPKYYILRRLSRMYYQFMKYDHIDISKQCMEVAPTAHYSMGGVLIDHQTGKTGVQGLYAIGEVTAGCHGGNRLGGNSLAEIMVFGRLTGKQVARDVKKKSAEPALDGALAEKRAAWLEKLAAGKKGRDPVRVMEEIQKLMWKHVGVVRNERDMKKGLKKLQKFYDVELKAGGALKRNEKLIAALNVRNMLCTCEMVIKSALFRKESRAAHYREDYLKTKPSWKKNILCSPTKTGFKLSTRAVKKPSKTVQKWLKKKQEIERHLLE